MLEAEAGHIERMGKGEERTAWPRLRGWMSRKARTWADSKSLKEGMSPGGDVNDGVSWSGKAE